MALDAHQQVARETLLGELDYSLPASASYVVDRRVSSFFTSSAGTYSSTGVRTFRISLSSDISWVDLSTLTLSFTIKNTIPTADNAGVLQNVLMCKTDGPWSLIQRMRIYVSGTVVEDIQYYRRLHEAFFRLSAKDVKMTEATRGFGYEGADGATLQRGYIARGEAVTVAFKPLSGLIASGKFFPVQWAPIIIECELANADVAWRTGEVGANPVVRFGRDYELSDARVNVDCVTLDSGMQEEYSKLLSGGSSLPLNITTFANFNQALLGENPVVALTRAASRIRDVMWSFTRANGITADYDHTLSWANDFYHPHAGMAIDGGARLTDLVNYQTQWTLGNKLLGDEQTIRFGHSLLQETYKALGFLNERSALPDIDRNRYLSDHHIGAVSLEKALNVAMTGLSSRSGSLLQVQFRNMSRPAYNGGAAVENPVSQIWITMMLETALSISKYGVVVAD